MTESINGGSENFYLSSHLLLLRPYKETWEAVSTVIGKKNAPPFIFSRVYSAPGLKNPTLEQPPVARM